MSSDNAILKVEGVRKDFFIWRSPSDRLTAGGLKLLQGFFGADSSLGRILAAKQKNLFRKFTALADLSFEARRGEVIGIVGRNGSGKSTLLQIIAGTLRPTAGTCTIAGRVAALLELGSGFNPEFTGRENVRLNASLLGISPERLSERLSAILDFADIGDFIDQPVKTYSSGMALRLAFAVQVQVEPDLLIVDEALAVGDEPFQRKCFAEIQSLRERGTTILFVSHSAWAITELCDRAFLLDHGELLISGTPKDVIKGYQRLCYASSENVARVKQELRESASIEVQRQPSTADLSPSTKRHEEESYFLENLASPACSPTPERGALIFDSGIYDSKDRKVNVLAKGRDYQLRYSVRFIRDFSRVRFGWTVKTLSGHIISGSATHVPGHGVSVKEQETKTVTFHFQCRFTPGNYVVDIACRSSEESDDQVIHGIIDALMFQVKPSPNDHRNGYFDCSIAPYSEIN